MFASVNWAAFFSGLIGTGVPGLIVSLLMLQLTKRVNQSLEKLKSELQHDSLKFGKWHEKRVEASIALYVAFDEYLDFLRRAFYVPNERLDVTPLHDFHRTIQRQAVFFDQTLANKVTQYSSELLQFWNFAVTSLSEDEQSARQLIRDRLDYEIPTYLTRLREDINIAMDPTYKRIAT
jgi:hypothetical protein